MTELEEKRKRRMHMKNTRYLFIDILKILGTVCVLSWHLFYNTQNLIWQLPYYGMIHLGGIGVLLFLFTSGVSLSLKEYNFSNKKEILDFYYKRLVRIYPATWISVLVTLMLLPQFFNNLDLLKLAEEFTGFYYYFQGDMPQLNSPLWYISLIVILYLLYPVLCTGMKKFGFIGFTFPFVLSLMIHITTSDYDYIFGHRAYWYFGALPNLWVFALGMWIAQSKFYPKNISDNVIIAKLSDISFYIYLLQFGVIQLYAINKSLFIVTLLESAYAFMLVDNKISKLLSTVYENLLQKRNADNLGAYPKTGIPPTF